MTTTTHDANNESNNNSTTNEITIQDEKGETLSIPTSNQKCSTMMVDCKIMSNNNNENNNNNNNENKNNNSNIHNDKEEEDDEDEEEDNMSIESNDSCLNIISLKSIRTDDDLEEAVTFTYPGMNRVVRLSTLLEPDDLAPLFAGAQWAGTRVWRAAIRAADYLATTYPPNENNKTTTLLELGCGLGVPGMIYHALGGNVVLTDQEEVMSQLEKNVAGNFPEGAIIFPSNREHEEEEGNDCKSNNNNNNNKATIQALPLNWSRPSLHKLLSQIHQTTPPPPQQHQHQQQQQPPKGFDIVLNCDCIYEPLYGKSWMYLSDVIDECLKINPNCIVLTSVERRNGDGVDKFLKRLEEEERHVGSVEKVWEDDCKKGENEKIEMYLCRGCL